MMMMIIDSDYDYDDDAGQVMEDFLSSLTPPPRRQNPLLRQLPATADTENIADLAPPGYRQNPLLREEIFQCEYSKYNVRPQAAEPRPGG